MLPHNPLRSLQRAIHKDAERGEVIGTPPGFSGPFDDGPYRGIVEFEFDPTAAASVPEPASLLAWCGCVLLGLAVPTRRWFHRGVAD